MKPCSFDYVRADRVQDIFEAFEHYGQEARILAGGQSLMAMINYRLARPKALIDISRCAELDYVQVRDGRLVVGAAVTQAKVQQREALAREVPLLQLAFPYITHSRSAAAARCVAPSPMPTPVPSCPCASRRCGARSFCDPSRGGAPWLRTSFSPACS